MPVKLFNLSSAIYVGSTTQFLYAPKDNEDNIPGTVIVHQPKVFFFFFRFLVSPTIDRSR